jgi:hypothetical protein
LRFSSSALYSTPPWPFLALQARAQLFVFGQAGPFVLCKMRHFFVTWAEPYRLVQLVFYSFFTSHLEVTITVAVDTVVAFALLRDWIGNIATDTRCGPNIGTHPLLYTHSPFIRVAITLALGTSPCTAAGLNEQHRHRHEVRHNS